MLFLLFSLWNLSRYLYRIQWFLFGLFTWSNIFTLSPSNLFYLARHLLDRFFSVSLDTLYNNIFGLILPVISVRRSSSCLVSRIAFSISSLSLLLLVVIEAPVLGFANFSSPIYSSSGIKFCLNLFQFHSRVALWRFELIKRDREMSFPLLYFVLIYSLLSQRKSFYFS